MAAESEYVMVHSRAMPRVDTSKSVKQVALGREQLARFNRWVRKWRRWLSLGYWVGVALGTVTLFVPSAVGVWLAIASMPLQPVPSVVSLMAMRYDLVRLVMQGYEFWYMTLSNLAVSTLISFSFNDARFLVLVGASVAFETALLLDANHRASRLLSVAAVLGAFTNIVYLACATFGLIEYGRDLELADYKHRILYADDVTANLVATLVVLLVRNGFRKFNHTDAQRKATCITIRARMTLTSLDGPRRLSYDARLQSSHSDIGKNRLVPLVCLNDGRRFGSADTLVHVLRSSVSVKGGRLVANLVFVTSWFSLFSWVVALLSADHSFSGFASTFSAGGVLLVFFCYLTLAQRQLLVCLLTSFDFIFLSLQVTLSHVCLADMVEWAYPRVLVVFTSWFWVHWVLILDAVLPVYKTNYLGFRPSIAQVAIVLFVAEQLVASIAAVFLDSSSDSRLQLRDRVIFTIPIHTHVKQLRVVPLLLGRAVATISWSLRLLWRLWDRVDNELLLIQGRVQYENSAPFSSIGSTHFGRSMLAIAPLPTTTTTT